MKKLLVMLLVVSVIMSLTIPVGIGAFAEEFYEDAEEATDFDISVSGEATGVNPFMPVNMSSEDAVISVQVSWDNPEFIYDFGDDWSPDALEYVNIPGWTKDYMEIIVSNRSNCVINASVKFEKNSNMVYKNVKTRFNSNSVDIDSAIDGHAKNYKFIMSISGQPLLYYDEYDIGKILISIGAPQDEESGTPNEEPSVPEEEEEEEPAPIEFLMKIASGEYENIDSETLNKYSYKLTRSYADELGLTFNEEDEEVLDGTHEHHFVYDQFGRLVCTGCDLMKHEFCVDYDFDGICDECGLERGEIDAETYIEIENRIIDFMKNGGKVNSWQYIELLNEIVDEFELANKDGFCLFCGAYNACNCYH